MYIHVCIRLLAAQRKIFKQCRWYYRFLHRFRGLNQLRCHTTYVNGLHITIFFKVWNFLQTFWHFYSPDTQNRETCPKRVPLGPLGRPRPFTGTGAGSSPSGSCILNSVKQSQMSRNSFHDPCSLTRVRQDWPHSPNVSSSVRVRKSSSLPKMARDTHAHR